MKRLIALAASGAAAVSLAACGSSSSSAAPSSSTPTPSATVTSSTPAGAVSASSLQSVGPVSPSATAAPRPASIPLKILKEKGSTLIIAPVTVKGTEYAFIVDTGASVTLLSDTFAKEAGIKPNGKTLPITGIGGGKEAQLADISGWFIGKAKLPTSTVGIATSTFSPTSKIAGLLGSDLLSTFGKITIDYKNQTASLG